MSEKMSKCWTGFKNRPVAKGLLVLMKGTKQEMKAHRVKTYSSSEMLEYSRGETEEWGVDRLLESGWVVISSAVCLSGNDV